MQSIEAKLNYEYKNNSKEQNMPNNNPIEKIKTHFMQYGYATFKDHYADFKGRTNRPGFWYFQLYMFITVFVFSFLSGLLNMPILSLLISIAFILPGLSISVRRLHDTGRCWYWMLLSIVPGILSATFVTSAPSLAMIFYYLQIAGNICLLVLFCQKGENKENAWGKAI